MNRKHPSQRRSCRFHFRVSQREKEIIKAYAELCHMTVSEYIRTVAENFEPKSCVNPNALNDLLRLNDDLNKLGNLLKLWLSDELQISYYKGKGVKNIVNKINEKIEDMHIELDKVVLDEPIVYPTNRV